MRNQTRITICTIVRNRAYLLPHVYETLLAQTRFHFEWLIMDQERQGQLRMLTFGWRGRTEPFVIRVAECQENGRMQAVQMALDVARGEYFCLLEAEEFLEPEAMACILDWLAQNFQNPEINAAMTAEQFKISKKYLSQFLKEQTGKSYTEYVEELRLDHAMQLLRTTDLNITDIAEQCGFSTANTFYKAFRRKYQLSPSAVRKGDN